MQDSSLEKKFLQWERNADDIYLMVIVYRISSSTASYWIQMLEKKQRIILRRYNPCFLNLSVLRPQCLKTKQFIRGRSRSKKFKFQDLIFSVLIWNSGRGTLPCGAKQIIETNFSKTSTKPKMRCSWLSRKQLLRLSTRILSTISKFQACKMYNESFIELHNRYL